MVAVGNGKLRDIKTENGYITYEWFVNNPICNYNISGKSETMWQFKILLLKMILFII